MSDTLQNRIKVRRKALSMSQHDLAQACGVGQSTVANWERGGHIPRQATLARIAKVLEIEEGWLITGEHSANHGPLNNYLTTPIRHIPVYDWPKNAQDFGGTHPQRYITMTIGPENVFALLAPKSGTDFKEGTILAFTRNLGETEGVFLFLGEDYARLEGSASPSNVPSARLIYSLTTH